MIVIKTGGPKKIRYWDFQIRVSAKVEFTNLNSTKKVRILFVGSEVEMDLRKRNRFSTKYLTGWKKTWVGIICGVVPQNLKILRNSWPFFCGIRDLSIFLGPTNFLWNRICEFRFREHSLSSLIWLLWINEGEKINPEVPNTK